MKPSRSDARWYFVSGLPEAVTEEDLQQHFIQYGTVLNVSIATNKATGQSRGFAYVEMADTASQDALLQDMHNLGGKAVSVMLTKDSLQGFNTNKVHLGKLPMDMSAEPIREVFSQFGIVLDVHLPKDPRTGERKNFGFVTFGGDEAVAFALAAGRVAINGVEVTISPAAQSRMEMMREAANANWATNAAASWGGFGGGDWGCSGAAWAGPEWGGPCWGGGAWGCGKGAGWDGSAGALMGPGNGARVGDGGQRRRADGTRYFLPGLPDSVGEYELREHFSRYGVVMDVAIVKEKGTERSRGFGYVTMQDASTREAIISGVHEFEGKPVTVMLTKDSLTGNDVKKVHLSKLTPDVMPDDIRSAFMCFGTVLDVHTPKDPKTGERKNFAFVTFDTQASFDAAIAAGSAIVKGQEVAIRPAAQCRDGGHPPGGPGVPQGPMGAGWDMACAGGKGPYWAWSGGAAGADLWPPSAWGKGGCMASGSCGSGRSQSSTPSDGRGNEGGAKFFVSGLPEWVTEAELQQHFSGFGEVNFTSVVRDKAGERSRGFGYVTLVDSAAQEPVLSTPHIFGDQQISVMLTKESLAGNVKKVHLGNLDTNIPVEAIRAVFSQFGIVLDVHTPKDPATGERRNYGFVSFSTDEAFQTAIAAGAALIGDCEVTIRPAAQSRIEAQQQQQQQMQMQMQMQMQNAAGAGWDPLGAMAVMGGKAAAWGGGCWPGVWEGAAGWGKGGNLWAGDQSGAQIKGNGKWGCGGGLRASPY